MNNDTAVARCRRWLATLACITAAAVSPPAGAFKINTHVWVGQQVINDLEDDGMLTVRLNGAEVRLPVRADVRDAILQNRNVYLLGNLGPDAMPDVLVGQVIMHPGGVQSDWRANDWASYVLRAGSSNPVGKAFAYGYLAHGAADVFAHTYVNQYAGDVFELGDGETLVEQRHIALESYVGRYTPPLLNAAGVNFGKPYDVVMTSDPLAVHLRDVLIYAADVQAQYLKEPAAAHLVAFNAYRSALNSLAENDIWRRLDVAVLQFTSAQFGIPLSSAQAGQALDLVASINDKLNRGINITQQELTDLDNRINALDLRFARGVKSALDRASALESQLLGLQSRLDSLLVEKACEQVDLVCPNITVLDTCYKGLIAYPCKKEFTDPVCREAFRSTCRALSLLNQLRDQTLAELRSQRSRLAAELLALHTELVQARSDHLALTNALVDLLQIPTQGSSPIQALLRNWRSDTDLVFADYVKAATQAMLNTMAPKGTASPLAPMQAWVDCNGPALMGVPRVVSGCPVRDTASRLLNTLDRLANLPADSVAAGVGLPTSTELKQLKAQVLSAVMAKVEHWVTGGLIRLLPQDVQDVVLALRAGDISDSELAGFFTKGPPASKRLAQIPDIITRLNREMNIGNGIFDPHRFAAAADAVTLAKLALLDTAGLDALAAHAGLSGIFTGVDNVVANAFVSFDGDHQWLSVAPPRPWLSDTVTRYAPKTFTDPASGRPRYTRDHEQGFRSKAGFALWSDGQDDAGKRRRALFAGLFIGPLSPGVENPGEIGLDSILAVGSDGPYPYRPCIANPFPASWRVEDGCGVLLKGVYAAPPPPAAPPALIPLPSSGLSPTSHGFGSVRELETKTVTITVSNSGGPAAVEISLVGRDAVSYRLNRGTCPAQGATLAASASCTVSVSFTGSAQCIGPIIVQSVTLNVVLTNARASSTASAALTASNFVYKATDLPCR
jgi:hypothetical protein